MGLFGRLIKDGWWEKGERSHLPIDIAKIPQEKINELYRDRKTVIDHGGTAYIVSIPADKQIPDLKPGDFQIVELPNVAASSPEKF